MTCFIRSQNSWVLFLYLTPPSSSFLSHELRSPECPDQTKIGALAARCGSKNRLSLGAVTGRRVSRRHRVYSRSPELLTFKQIISKEYNNLQKTLSRLRRSSGGFSSVSFSVLWI